LFNDPISKYVEAVLNKKENLILLDSSI